jgi:hypothetical protein
MKNMKAIWATLLAVVAAQQCDAETFFPLADDAEVFTQSLAAGAADFDLIDCACRRCGGCCCGNTTTTKPWTVFATQTADYGTNLTLPIGLTPANTLLGFPGDPSSANILTDTQAALLGVLGNLGLAPVPPGPTPQAFFPNDFQFQTTAGAQYQKAIGENGTLTASYTYYQNLHPTVEQLNLQSHTPTIQYAHKLNDRLVSTSYYTYTYYFLDGQSYVDQNRTGTGLTYSPNQRWALSTRFDFNHANFQPAPFINSNNYAGVFEATRFYGDGTNNYIRVGYGAGYSDAQLRGYSYQINNVYGIWRRLFGTSNLNEIRITGTYGLYNFFGTDPFAGIARDDRIYSLSFFLGRNVTKHLQLFASYTYLNSDSNVVRQEYDSSLTSIGASFSR